MGGHHRRQLAGSLGHERRFDDGDRTSALRCSTSRPPTTTRRHRWPSPTTATSLRGPADRDDDRRRAPAAPTTSTCKARSTIPGYTFRPTRSRMLTIKGFDTDSTAIQALESGQVDAVVSAQPTLQAAIDKGARWSSSGEPLFYEPLSVAIDKASDLDQASLVDGRVRIVDEMHADGTLSELSMEWFGEDLTVPPSDAFESSDPRTGGYVATQRRGPGTTRPPAQRPTGRMEGTGAGERPGPVPAEGGGRLDRDLRHPRVPVQRGGLRHGVHARAVRTSS